MTLPVASMHVALAALCLSCVSRPLVQERLPLSVSLPPPSAAEIAGAPPCARALGEYLAALASGTATGDGRDDAFLRARGASRKLGGSLRMYEVHRDHPWDVPTLVMVMTDGALSDAEMRARFAEAGSRRTSTYGRVAAIEVPANQFGCVADLDFVLFLDLPAPVSIQ